MAISLFDLWEKFCGEMNTHQGGHVRPHRQFTQWVNTISFSKFEEKFAGAWEKDQKIIDDLGRPFLITKPVQASSSGPTYDVYSFPEGYGHISAARYFHRIGEYNGCENCFETPKSPAGKNDFSYKDIVLNPGIIEQPIEIVKSDKWGAAMKHRIKRPTVNNPKMTQYSEGFKVSPKGIGTLYIDFLRKPNLATFDYTVGTDDQIIFNAVTSKSLEWPDVMVNEFLTELGMKYGKYIREAFIYQTSDKENATTV